ncbi:MAG: sigma-70 family RNA polymerase sigma factor [Bacteroidales bacterium]|nr:sigma-70 family RNA polymerase sigma factor [Bacteroidales bacterium]
MKAFWTRAYRKNIEKMIGVCYRYVLDRPTAEDLAHDAFLTAIEKADTFRGFGSFEGWMMRIAANKALLYLREQERIRPLKGNAAVTETDTADEDEPSPDDMMAAIRKADFSQEEILDAIAQLPDHHRTVLNLYVFERLTHLQIAELLDISPNTSKSHLLRARKELQKILFNKSKEKKHLLMILLPFIHPDAAIDGYCRSQLKDFAIPPLQPLKEEAFSTSSKVSPKLWLYAHRLPFIGSFAATGAAIAAGILLFPSLQDNPTATPQVAKPQPVMAAADSIAENDSEESALLEAGNSGTVTKHSTLSSSAPSTPLETAPADNQTVMSQTTQPVVVKKIRRTKHIIVIQDSTK